MAREITEDPVKRSRKEQLAAIQKEPAEDIPDDLVDWVSEYKKVRSSTIGKSIATARDIRMGRSGEGAVASKFPDYGPGKKVSAEKKAELGADLARISANLVRSVQRGASTEEIDSLLTEHDKTQAQLEGKMIAERGATSRQQRGLKAARNKELAAEQTSIRDEHWPSEDDLPTDVKTQAVEAGRVWRTTQGKETPESTKEHWNAFFGTLSGAGDFPSLTPAQVETYYDLVAKRGGMGSGESMILHIRTRYGETEWEDGIANNGGVNLLQKQFDGTSGKAEARDRLHEIGVESDENAKAMERGGAYQSKRTQWMANEIHKLRKENLAWVKANPGQGNKPGFDEQVAAIQGKTLKKTTVEDRTLVPGETEARDDLDKAWELLEAGSEDPVIVQLRKKIMADDGFTKFKEGRGYTDDDYAFKQLLKAVKAQKKTTKKEHEKVRKTNLVTGVEEPKDFGERVYKFLAEKLMPAGKLGEIQEAQETADLAADIEEEEAEVSAQPTDEEPTEGVAEAGGVEGVEDVEATPDIGESISAALDDDEEGPEDTAFEAATAVLEKNMPAGAWNAAGRDTGEGSPEMGLDLGAPLGTPTPSRRKHYLKEILQGLKG